MKGKQLLIRRRDVDRFVELIARSKAIWMVPELQNLVVMASSPSVAYKLVLQKTGRKRKALAARQLAVALRDYDPMLVRSAIRYLEGPGDHRLDRLKAFISTMLTLEDERY